MQNHCQIPTPTEYVKSMLNLAGYTENLYGKTVLENSCGSGGILVEIVCRYIVDSRSHGYTDDEIKIGIERDIKAYEIDPECVSNCIANLDAVARKLGIQNVVWNIECSDYLKSDAATYDFIAGNPPYVTYHDLDLETREYLSKNFLSCSSGRFDYYYAFIEKSMASLKPKGSMVYLVPFGIFRNKFAQILREYIKPNIISIVDYRGVRVFGNVTSSATLIHVVSESNTKMLTYSQTLAGLTMEIDKAKLKDKWFFEEQSSGSRFGDYFSIKNSVATLCNEAFLITEYTEDENYIIVNGKRVEKAITRNAVSTKSCKKKATDKIIFPYQNYDGGYVRISEDMLKCDYPCAFCYLSQYKDTLLKRTSSKGVMWYEYGRTQALRDVFGKKLLMSMIITTKVKIYTADEASIPYAGYFIKIKEGSKYDLTFAKKLLESDEFYNYVKNTGTPTTPSSYRISVKDVEDYMFVEQEEN